MASGGSGVKADALGSYGTATGTAASVLPTLSSVYEDEAQHPTGYSPVDLARMRTGAEQSAGGGVASAVGQGNLMAGRTGNIGGFQVAADDAARLGEAEQGGANLKIDAADADLAEKKQQAGLAGLSSIYDESSHDALNALNIANEAKPTWLQSLTGQLTGGAVGNLFGAALKRGY